MSLPRAEPVENHAPPGSSIYYALRFLPPELRQALHALHGLVQEVRAIPEQVSDPGVAAAKLDWWQTELARACAGQAQHPTLRLLAPQLHARQIDARLLTAIVEGARRDAEAQRFFNFASLRHYCEHAGGIPMEVAARLLGHRQEATLRYAHTLGQALQLTLLLRDTGRHAAQGRLYLPVDELQRFDVRAQDVLQRQSSPALTALLRFQGARAMQMLDEAQALLPDEDRRAQKPGLILARIARALLNEIADSNYPVLQQRISLTPLRKFWLAWRVQALG
jgi:phytoene synthase